MQTGGDWLRGQVSRVVVAKIAGRASTAVRPGAAGCPVGAAHLPSVTGPRLAWLARA